ncbi:NineTeen Complex (NTC) component [Geranomyces michiganensis]|nr:NineTeen Complex (NTC) component [Geranomyces michiganensis]
MLYRFREAQNAELGLSNKTERRPYLASEVNTLKEAEKWRRQLIGEVSKKVSKIQDSGLTEYQVRDLNDEINKLLREKRHWENRIRELGGPDYRKIGTKMIDSEGKEVPGGRGYKYFGRARDLPGVKELFEQEAPELSKSSRHDLYRRVDADYYGYRDEEDGALLEYEAGLANDADDDDTLPDAERDAPAEFVSHVGVPSQKEVEAWLVRRRQQELADRFLSDENTLSKEIGV